MGKLTFSLVNYFRSLVITILTEYFRLKFSFSLTNKFWLFAHHCCQPSRQRGGNGPHQRDGRPGSAGPANVGVITPLMAIILAITRHCSMSYLSSASLRQRLRLAELRTEQ